MLINNALSVRACHTDTLTTERKMKKREMERLQTDDDDVAVLKGIESMLAMKYGDDEVKFAVIAFSKDQATEKGENTVQASVDVIGNMGTEQMHEVVHKVAASMDAALGSLEGVENV